MKSFRMDHSNGSGHSGCSEPEPVAIVGIACRLPGGVDSPSSLWRLLREGRSGQCDVPSSRFNIDGWYQKGGPETPGNMNMKGGYFLKEDIRSFDHEFFGILSAEATHMDPQQRKLLEVVYECFESAGVTLDQISGSNTGCYVGNFTYDYANMQTKDPEYLSRFSATGMGSAILSNRISHTFNMQGPSQVIDTACSSSLYCIHASCSALENGECDGAIVASANLIQSVEQHLGMMKAGVLSPTSTCHTFSDIADGYGRADAIGALYLKRLSDAIRDNDPIRAVIRGVAVGSNGKTSGISAPNASAQANVIRQAYKKARLDYSATSYIECHGTGTPAGDPVEVEALSRVFKRETGNPLFIGSMKPNVGHGEGTSGLSGVIKTVLAIENRQIPPTIGVERINPKIRTAEWGVEIVTSNKEWQPSGARSSPKDFVRAGVNCFGYGGATSHVILESAEPWISTASVPAQTNQKALDGEFESSTRSFFLLPFSATNAHSLKARVSDLQTRGFGNRDITDLAYTLGCRRTHFSVRGFITGHRDSLLQDLSVESLKIVPSMKQESHLPSFAMIFTGQGAQWPSMGKELFNEFQVFRRSIRDMDEILSQLPDPPSWTLEGLMLDPDLSKLVHQAKHAQPMATALQIATTELLVSWNIYPTFVIGHSSGEIAAAFAGGYLSSAEAITVAYYRGYVNSLKAVEGAMLAVGLGFEEAVKHIDRLELHGKVRPGCINSPENVTISGDADAIALLQKDLESRNVFARKLNTGGKAYHSHHMTALGPELVRLLQMAIPRLPSSRTLDRTAEFISTVTSEPKRSNFDANYWRNNMESPVLFSQAVQNLLKRDKVHIIEVGPHSALALPLKQIRSGLGIPQEQFAYSTAITRFQNGAVCILDLVGRLYALGHQISFDKVNSGGQAIVPRVVEDLPPYAWQNKKVLWSEPRASYELRNRKYPHHELLGSLMPGGDGLTQRWRNKLQLRDVSWLSSHKLEDTVIFPAAGYMAMAIEAILQLTDTSRLESNAQVELKNVKIMSALMVTEDEVEIFTTFHPQSVSDLDSNSWWDFEIVSRQCDASNVHTTGSVSIRFFKESASTAKSTPDADMKRWRPAICYQQLASAGLNFGPDFQSLQEVHVKSEAGHHRARLIAPILKSREKASGPSYIMHPITIDALLQGGIIASSAGSIQDIQGMVPVYIESAVFRGSVSDRTEDKGIILASAKAVSPKTVALGAQIYNRVGQLQAQLTNAKLVSYTPVSSQQVKTERQPMLRVSWRPCVWLNSWNNCEISEHLDHFFKTVQCAFLSHDRAAFVISHVLSLLGHKSPNSRLLELSDPDPVNCKSWVDKLGIMQAVQGFRSCTLGYRAPEGDLLGTRLEVGSYKEYDTKSMRNVYGHTYDVIILPNLTSKTVSTGPIPDSMITSLIEHLTQHGYLMAVTSTSDIYRFERLGLDIIHQALTALDEAVIIFRKKLNYQDKIQLRDTDVVIVERDDSGHLNEILVSNLTSFLGCATSIVKLSQLADGVIPQGAIVISTLELELPLLSTLSQDEMKNIKVLTDNASKILWVTGGGLLDRPCPDYALASGLARSIMLEQPNTSFYTFDVPEPDISYPQTARNLISVLSQHQDSAADFEFVQHDGQIHISRFVTDENINRSFRQKLGDGIEAMALTEATPCKLKVPKSGLIEKAHFEREAPAEVPLECGIVEIEIREVGLNSLVCCLLNALNTRLLTAKDVQLMSGEVESEHGTYIHNQCGVVRRIGKNVAELRPGDRVVIMAPCQLSTRQRVPEWACSLLRQEEKFDTVCNLPYTYSTALWAIHYRARVEFCETVLVQGGASLFGAATIQVARLTAAEVFVTVNDKIEQDLLVSKLGLDERKIFCAKEDSVLDNIMAATNGRGIDVIINAHGSWSTSQDTWKACAPFGRIVELGNEGSGNRGKLDMESLKHNVTFSTISLSDLFYDNRLNSHVTWNKLLTQSMTMYRAGNITPLWENSRYSVSELAKACQHLSVDRGESIILSLQDANALIPVRPLKYDVTFDAKKSYILVGGFGGVGRSIAKWMLSRGARKLVFLGRSGARSPKSKELLERLDAGGAEVKVMQTDITNYAEVKRTISAVDGSIGGIVHAAMGLSEALFTQMSAESWRTGIDPKVKGCWNLHNAIKGRDTSLEFFLMISSVSGSVGAIAQSNYCAANYFLDVFTRYRRSFGLPATSVGLGMLKDIGYLSENPEVEAKLARSGITGLDEDEMLQVINLALTSPREASDVLGDFPAGHLLTGLEQSGYESLQRRGSSQGSSPLTQDPRASIITATFVDVDQKSGDKSARDESLPLGVSDAVLAGASLPEAVASFVRKDLGLILSMDPEDICPEKSLPAYGVDSMIATEVRTWLFQAFKVDVSLFKILSKSVTIQMITELVVEEISKA